jgi:hypothetical protein
MRIKMETKKLEEIVIQAFTEYPETISSNVVLWGRISKRLATQHNIITAEGFIMATLQGKIPSSHTLAAAITNVRRRRPEFIPTEEQKARKMKVQEQEINRYNQI